MLEFEEIFNCHRRCYAQQSKKQLEILALLLQSSSVMIVDDDSVVEMARDWRKLAEKVKRKNGEKLQFLDLDLCE